MLRKQCIWILIFIINLPFFSSAQTLSHRIDSLEKEIQRSSNTAKAVDDLNQQATYFIRLLEWNNADHVITRATQLSDSIGYKEGQINSLLSRARFFTLHKKYKSVPPVLDECQKEIQALDHPQKFFGQFYHLKGLYYSRRLKSDSALKYFSLAEKTIPPASTDPDDLKLLATILSSQAYSLSIKKQGDSAAKKIIEAITLAEKLNDPILLMGSYSIFGDIFYNQALDKDALHYYEKSAAIAKELGMQAEYGLRLHGCALAASSSGDQKKALQYFSEAVNVLQFANDTDQYVLTLSDYSDALIAVDSLAKAEQMTRRGVALQDFSKLTFTNFSLLVQLGNVLHLEKKYDEEWKNIERAEKLVGDSHIPDCIITLARQKVDYYAATGDYKKALAMQQQVDALNDSINKANMETTVAELNTKYETAKKDKEISSLSAEKEIAAAKNARQQIAVFSLIALLLLLSAIGYLIYQRIQLRRKTEMEIAKLERVNEIQTIRNKISRDMHDDVGVNLSKISMLAQQAKLKMKDHDVENSIALFDRITDQSREVISGLSSIVWAINPQHDNLKSMLGFMSNYAMQFFEGTDIKCRVDFPEVNDQIKIHPELKQNLFLVLKESMNNIAKHSGANEVRVKFVMDRNNYHFEISDNGKGIDESKDKTFSNGLLSMKKRMEEISGTFAFLSKPGKGMRIDLEGTLYS